MRMACFEFPPEKQEQVLLLPLATPAPRPPSSSCGPVALGRGVPKLVRTPPMVPHPGHLLNTHRSLPFEPKAERLLVCLIALCVCVCKAEF